MQDKSDSSDVYLSNSKIRSHAKSIPASVAELLQQLGLAIPKILLPDKHVDLSVWPVIACDQYTSQPDYWQETADIVAGRPSTLELVLPELYLDEPGEVPIARRIEQINDNMCRYLEEKILVEQEPGCVLVDRSTSLHASRKGLVIAIDLEQYDFTPGNSRLIRATEGTVTERIPPRQAVRRRAALELPHVQLLIDDPDRSVIEPLWQKASDSRPIYDIDLIQGGGHVRGYFITHDNEALLAAFQAMHCLKTLRRDHLLFAVGDGNHSLATAQAHWYEIREQSGPDHPARFALVEIINIHDKGLDFEPIHRAVFGVDPVIFMDAAKDWLESRQAEHAAAGHRIGKMHALPVVLIDRTQTLPIPLLPGQLVAAEVQNMLDQLMPIFKRAGLSARIDYIHGENAVCELAEKGAIGLILPAFCKDSFFRTIVQDGILPRKTFSMGESFEKRYYFECRKIIQD